MFKKNPNEPFIKVEGEGVNKTVRVAVADKMQAPACVACHNSHPETPKRDWKMGDVPRSARS